MASIQLNKDGPMVVKGVTELKNSRGEALDAGNIQNIGKSGNDVSADSGRNPGQRLEPTTYE